MSVSTALELHARGREENGRGRHAAASEILQAALRELAGARAESHAEVARVRILLSLAWSLAELDGLDRGLARLRDVYEILGSGALAAPDAQALRTPLHNQHGLLLLRAGRTDAALVQFAEAERWFAHAPILEQCNVLLNRGALGINTLEIARARADLTRCAELARTDDLSLLEFKARHNLGYLEFLAGDLPRALAVMDDAASIHVDHQRGVPLVDRARVLMEAGLTREADEALAQAISLLGTDDSSTHDFAEATLEQARCRMQSLDWDSTLACARRAQSLFLARGNARRARTAALLELMAQIGLGRHDAGIVAQAQTLAAELLAARQQGDARTAAALAARLLIDSGETDKARELLDGLGRVNSRDRISLKVLHRLVRAELAFATGDAARGRREVRSGLSELTTYRARFGSIDAQTASAVHGVELSELDLKAAVCTATPASIFGAVERSRSLAGGMAAVRPSQDDATVTLLAELRDLTLRLQTDSVAASDVDALLARRLELHHAIKSREWRHRGSTTERRLAALAHICDDLEQSAASMVMFFELGGEIYALPLGARARHPIFSGRSTVITEQAQRLRADLNLLANESLPLPIHAAVRRSVAHLVTELDDALVRPLRLNERGLVIVPTGTLGLLPWGMLPSLKGVPVTVAPSATSWQRSRELAQPVTQAARVVALAGPHLNRAAEEAHHIAAAWVNGASHVERAATGTALRAALSTADIVHVAAHGQHDRDNPLFSSISLADGQVFGYDLVTDVRSGVHVVLSACELGLATIRPGDEPLGLTRALLHYGAATVIASVARIADSVAAEAMMRHHGQLAAGIPPAKALAGATDGNHAAPFVCFGSGIA
jgi:tetratricopeptide (TPR) repeat protein